jgi:hypothetical protein
VRFLHTIGYRLAKPQAAARLNTIYFGRKAMQEQRLGERLERG